MFYVNYEKKAIKIRAIWFATKREIELEKECDILFYHQASFPEEKYCTEYCTLVSNLQLDEEELFAKLHKYPREAIRRASGHMDFEILNSDNLGEFVAQYNVFAKSKGLNTYNTPLMKAYNEQNRLTVTKVSLDNKPLIYCSYIDDGNCVRGLTLANNYRLESSTLNRNIFGRASRYLEWRSMLYFKERGLKKYDWGGYSTSEETKNIAQYKKAFGGELEYSNNILVSCSIIGKIALYILSIKNFISGLKRRLLRK